MAAASNAAAGAASAVGAKPITDLSLTYTMAAPDDSFSRLLKISAGVPVFLWAKRADGDKPITELKVVYDDQAPGEDFTPLPVDLNKDKKVFLAIRKGGSGSPIIDVRVFAENEGVEEQFVKVEGDLLRTETGPRQFLYVKTQASKAKSRDFQVGEFIDASDSVQKWCVARVVDKRENEIYIHYEGWSDRWNEWIPINSERLAPYRTRSKGRDTGPENNDRAYRLSDPQCAKEFGDVYKRLEQLLERKDKWGPEDMQFITGPMGAFVSNCLSSV